MHPIVIAILGGLATAAVGLATVFVVGVRTRSPLVLRPLFAIGRRFFHSRALQQAGRPGSYASIIRHRGRRTGQLRETPVGVVAIDEGFLVTLPYGTYPQWVRNVLAAGQATLVTEGRAFRVDRPELIPMRPVLDRFSRSDQWAARLLAMTDCLVLRRDASDEAFEMTEPFVA